MNEQLKCNLPLVSVAVATYNGDKFLREQLDSIYNQTYSNLEVVVSDDCSTDKTLNILEEYHSKYGLKYFVNKQRLGLVKNFERSISLCKGEYIALSDQDDIWHYEKIKTLVNEIGKYTLIYSHTSEVIDARGNPIEDVQNISHITRSQYLKHMFSTFGTGKPTKNLIACNWVASHQVLFKKELVKVALPIPSHQDFHDGWIAICASKINGIKFLDKSLIKYRRHCDSFTFSNLSSNQSLGDYLRKPFRFFEKSRKNDRVKYYKNDIDRLRSIKKSSISFTENEKRFVDELVSYYTDISSTSRIHWQSFILSIKYAHLLCWSSPGIMHKLVFCFKSLIN